MTNDPSEPTGPLTYWDYLGLKTLLDLQKGRHADESELMPDELHFIIVHQAFELWFKLVLSELRLARNNLAEPRMPEQRVPAVVHHFRRVNTILELAVAQFRVMETLTPQDFLAFRDALVPASGFQSFQMREIECVLGLGTEERRRAGLGDPLAAIRAMAATSPTGAMAAARVEAALAEKSVQEALHDWLYRTPISGSSPADSGDEAVVEAFVQSYLEALQRYHERQIDAHVTAGTMGREAASGRMTRALEMARAFFGIGEGAEAEAVSPRLRRVRAAALFIESYRELPLLAWPRLLLDAVVEVDEQLVLFRSRHARMVERIIGRRLGTGGSDGVDYLDRTATYRIFRELWAIRTFLLPREAMPDVVNPDYYAFARHGLIQAPPS